MLPLEVTKKALARYGAEEIDGKTSLTVIQHEGRQYAITYQEACREAAEILGPREKLAADIGLYVMQAIMRSPSLVSHVNHIIRRDLSEMIKMLEELR